MSNNVSKTLVVDFVDGRGSGGSGGSASNGGELVLIYDTRPVLEGGLNPRKRPLLTDTAKFLLYSFRAGNIQASASSGDVVIDSAKQTQVLQETITFDQSSKARVKRPVSKILSVQWVGNDGGNITAEGSKVSISESGSLVAIITYETLYQVITLTPPQVGADVEEYTVNLSVTADEVI